MEVGIGVSLLGLGSREQDTPARNPDTSSKGSQSQCSGVCRYGGG